MLDIRPLLWKDGWPVAGDNLKEGIYEIESARTGTALELAVEGMPVGGRRARRGGGPALGGPGATGEAGGAGTQGRAPGPASPGSSSATGTGAPIPAQEVTQVSTNWPTGNIDVRMSNYLCQAQQKWTIATVPNAGGYFGSPYFKITTAGTERALAVTPQRELISLPAFTGGPEQLWRIEQLSDGTWRITPKAVPNTKETLALSAIGSSFATLSRFNPDSDKQRWLLKSP